MKDKLEEFILEHRDEFDTHQPSAEVWLKIQKRQSQSLGRFNWKGFLWKAAVVAVIFGSSLLFFELLHQRGIHLISFGDKEQEIVIPELKEAELYYSSVLEEKMEEIEPMLTNHPGMENEINRDLSELDSVYKELKKDLKDNIATEEVVQALIQNYRMRIDILEEILAELHEVEKIDSIKVKENNYEI